MEETEQDEQMDVEPMMNIRIYNVPLSTMRAFQAFAKAYAYNKYSIALQLLLDRSAVLEMYSTHENRLRILENRMGLSQPEENNDSGKKKRKTFGGV